MMIVIIDDLVDNDIIVITHDDVVFETQPALCHKRSWEGALYKWLAWIASDATLKALYKWSTFA